MTIERLSMPEGLGYTNRDDLEAGLLSQADRVRTIHAGLGSENSRLVAPEELWLTIDHSSDGDEVGIVGKKNTQQVILKDGVIVEGDIVLKDPADNFVITDVKNGGRVLNEVLYFHPKGTPRDFTARVKVIVTTPGLYSL